MPDWNSLLGEIGTAGSPYDVVRRRYLKALFEHTTRNTIVYYSGWLQKPQLAEQGARFAVNDSDKNGFMTTIHNLDRSRGLDLILHTPGGEMAATESIVDYLRAIFGTNIRVIVPQIAMSGGTMIACAAQQIIMGKESSLGPIDPQIGGVAAHGIVEEFKRARDEILANPATIPLWQPIIAKYHPTLIGESEKVIGWANEMVRQWLMTGMFENHQDRDAKADRVIAELADHALTKSHDRHISLQRAREIGLEIYALEDNDDLQDAVLSVHHACIHTLTGTNATKFIENHLGIAYIESFRTIAIQA